MTVYTAAVSQKSGPGSGSLCLSQRREMTLLMSQYRSQEKHDKSQCDNCDDEAHGGPWDGVILRYSDPHLIQSGQG